MTTSPLRQLQPTPLVGFAAALDLVSVSVFALVGRRSHDEVLDLAGWWQTAWPFLAGLALGWLLVVATLGRYPTRLWHGLPVWLSTVFGGMAFRDMTGQGTALPFVVVATLVVGAMLVGWRLVLARRLRQAARDERAERRQARAQERGRGRGVVASTVTDPGEGVRGRGVVAPEDVPESTDLDQRRLPGRAGDQGADT